MKFPTYTLNKHRDAITTTISRYIIPKIKSGVGTQFEVEFSNHTYIDDGIEFPIKIDFVVSVDLDSTVEYDYDISASTDTFDLEDLMIHIDVVINSAELPEIMSEIVPELKDIITHELYHIYQEVELEMVCSDLYYDSEDDLENYFLMNCEISAFVTGLYKNAKTRRIGMDTMFDVFFYQYRKRITDDGMKRVRAVWEKYAKDNLPNVKWDKDGRE